jgi:hypothetical protein
MPAALGHGGWKFGLATRQTVSRRGAEGAADEIAKKRLGEAVGDSNHYNLIGRGFNRQDQVEGFLVLLDNIVPDTFISLTPSLIRIY